MAAEFFLHFCFKIAGHAMKNYRNLLNLDNLHEIKSFIYYTKLLDTYFKHYVCVRLGTSAVLTIMLLFMTIRVSDFEYQARIVVLDQLNSFASLKGPFSVCKLALS